MARHPARARGSQPCVDLTDCRRTRLPRPLMGDLIRAGALDGLGSARRQLLWALGGLQYQEDTLVEAPDIPADLPELTEREAMGWDYELIGLSPDDHPLRLWRPGCAAELLAQPAGSLVKVAGLVLVRQAPPTAHGHLFIILENETGLVNLIIRPDFVTQTIKLPSGRAYGLNDWEFVLATGVLQRQGSAVNVVVTHICPLTSTNLASVAADPAHPSPC
jgi:error-prone DNA polymerase